MPARLKSLEASIAAISATSVVTHLSDLEAVLPCLGKPGVYRHWDKIEMNKLTSFGSLSSKATQVPCTISSTTASATTTIDGWHRTSVQKVRWYTILSVVTAFVQAGQDLRHALST